mmetsp:Transcript_23147/g.63950  ORF Transcript_23147/g.63950 Transcript_23147/m.63950 type:complete len:174 (+) Transcript_23147:808-1329(+)
MCPSPLSCPLPPGLGCHMPTHLDTQKNCCYPKSHTSTHILKHPEKLVSVGAVHHAQTTHADAAAPMLDQTRQPSQTPPHPCLAKRNTTGTGSPLFAPCPHKQKSSTTAQAALRFVCSLPTSNKPAAPRGPACTSPTSNNWQHQVPLSNYSTHTLTKRSSTGGSFCPLTPFIPH